MIQDNLVIVIDTSNYRATYSEEVPFKAVVTEKFDLTIWVKSINTGKEYELYYDQILEGLEMEDIVKLLDLSKYGT